MAAVDPVQGIAILFLSGQSGKTTIEQQITVCGRIRKSGFPFAAMGHGEISEGIDVGQQWIS